MSLRDICTVDMREKLPPYPWLVIQDDSREMRGFYTEAEARYYLTYLWDEGIRAHVRSNIPQQGALWPAVARCEHGRPLGGNPCPKCPCTPQLQSDPDGPTYPQHSKLVGRDKGRWFTTRCTRCGSLICGTPLGTRYVRGEENRKWRIFQAHSMNPIIADTAWYNLLYLGEER